MPVVRSLPDHAVQDAAIIETVTTRPGLHIGEVIAATGLTAHFMRAALARLVKAKRIVIGGSGRGQRVSVSTIGAPGPALPALPAVPPGPPPARPSGPVSVSSSTDLVTRRDDAIAAAVKRSKGPAAFMALLDAMPAEPWESAQAKQEALSNVLRRLRAKQIVQQIDGGWAAA